MTDSSRPRAPDGVLETSLYVDDLARARDFYERVMGCVLLSEFGARGLALDAGGRSVLLLFVRGASVAGGHSPGGFVPGHDGAGPQHLAFAIAGDALDDWERRLVAAGVAIESRVTWPRGGTSLYFRDPDGHSVELVTPGTWATY